MNGPVVVGVDDLEHSSHAMTAAANEARIRGVPLWLVHAYHPIRPIRPALSDSVDVSDEAMRGSAQMLLDEAADLIRTDHPGLAIETVPASGPAAQCLAEACPAPSLLVVGGRGRGGFSGLMVGSVALRLLTQAHTPVLVVRGEAGPVTGRVLVGIDVADPVSGPELLEFAFDAAAARDAGISAIHAWEDNRYLYLTVGGQYVTAQFESFAAQHEKRLDTVLAPWKEKYPDIAVSRHSFAGSPAKVLVESSEQADLVVIGGRIRAHGHDGMRIGAFAHIVLHHAHCPVVIVPEH